MHCFQEKPNLRPTFLDIKSNLVKIYDALIENSYSKDNVNLTHFTKGNPSNKTNKCERLTEVGRCCCEVISEMLDISLAESSILVDHLCKALPVQYVIILCPFCIAKHKVFLIPLDINVNPFTSDFAAKLLAGRCFNAGPSLWSADLTVL